MSLRRSRVARAWLLALVGLGCVVAPRSAVADDGAIVQWVRRTAIPFATCDPGGDTRDLAPLGRIVGGAHIVALGEGTCGTREFVQLEQRIVEHLATRNGFTTVAIQANLPETQRLNDYIRTGRGDPRALLSGLKYWPLDTEEMLALVEWMRRFNASGRGRLQLAGYDMIKSDVPAEITQMFLRRADPAWADTLEDFRRRALLARQARAQGMVARADFPVKDAAGHHVRFSGWIRTRDVTDYAGLWWRADAQGGVVAFDNMEHQQLRGTHDWQRYAVDLDVPDHADHVVFGALMVGTGAAWFDSLAVEIDGHPWTQPSPALAMESADNPAGFSMTPPPGYSAVMDDSAAASGRWSLRLSSMRDFVAPDPEMQWTALERTAEGIVQRFESERQADRRRFPPDSLEWAARNAHVLLQWTRAQQREGVADSSRAANVEWLLQRAPKGSKIVLCGHNTTIARAPGAMGERLARRFGRDMVVIGLATNDGRCTTTRTTSANLEATEIAPGPAGSFEGLAHASGVPRFLLDLRRAPPGSAVAARLAHGLTLRSIGPRTPDQQFWPSALSREYDAIAWVGTTRATRPLPH